MIYFNTIKPITIVFGMLFCFISEAQTRRDYLAIKTNALYDVVSAVNIGVEIPMSCGYSLELSGAFPDWVDKRNNRFCFQLEMVEGQLKKYWQSESIDGWFSGVYTQYGKGCVQLSPQKGYRINRYCSAGLCLGYVFRIKERLAIECGAGIGYCNMQYDYYRIEEYNNAQLLASQSNWRDIYSIWPFPTKIMVSINYVIQGEKR